MNADANVVVPVCYEIRAMQRLDGCGSFRAAADIIIGIQDVLITLINCHIRVIGSRFVSRGPMTRDLRTGLWRDAVELPPELAAACGAELMADFEAMARKGTAR
jgi:hypothetical protein